MFGHEECLGDKEHCQFQSGGRRFDTRPSHPLPPAFRRVIITEALKKVVESGDKVMITLILESAKDVKKAFFKGKCLTARVCK